MTLAVRCTTLAASLFLVACDATISPPEPSEPPAKLSLELDWNAIDQIVATSAGAARGSALMAEDPNPVNRVGVRIEYPGEDAVFMQTVDRTTAEQTGLISMVLPPTNNAKLYVLAVHEKVVAITGDVDRAKAMAYLDLGKLTPGKAFKLTTGALTMVPATWTVESPNTITQVGDVANINIESSEQSQYTLRLLVQDPFGDVLARAGSRRFLELNGTGSIPSWNSGIRLMTVPVSRNAKTSGQTTIVQNFYPYVNGALFNLGDRGRFGVYPSGKVTVTWR